MNLVKYLPEQGIGCDVLTVKPVAYRHFEPELLDEIKETEIYRAGSYDPQRLMYLMGIRRVREKSIKRSRGIGRRFFPDSKTGWVKQAAKLGRRLANEGRYDAVISTSPPISCHLVGRALRQAHGIPWVVDFRDLWTAYSIEDWYDDPAKVKRARELLDEIRADADVVTAVNQQVAAYTEASEVIRNAYDPDRAQLWGSSSDTEHFIIGMLGTVDVMRPAEPLLHLMARLRTDYPGEFKYLKMIQVGDLHDYRGFQAVVEDLDLEERVECHGAQARQTTIELLSSASALYIGTAGPSSAAVTTGRIYDMIASGRPLLVAAEEQSELAGLTRRLPEVIRFDPVTDVSSTAVSTLAQWIRAWRRGDWKVSPVPDYSQPFSAVHQAEQFAAVIRRLVSVK
jgi:glycosyltransferase involved in cell wall biosynthesis